MRYENDRLLSQSGDHKTLYVSGMPFSSRTMDLVTEQEKIMQTDGAVAVEVEYPHFAAGAVGVRVRRLTVPELEQFVDGVNPALQELEGQVNMGGGPRSFNAHGVLTTWQDDLRHASTLVQQILPKVEQRLTTEGGNAFGVQAARRQVSEVTSRAAWQKRR